MWENKTAWEWWENSQPCGRDNRSWVQTTRISQKKNRKKSQCITWLSIIPVSLANLAILQSVKYMWINYSSVNKIFCKMNEWSKVDWFFSIFCMQLCFFSLSCQPVRLCFLQHVFFRTSLLSTLTWCACHMFSDSWSSRVWLCPPCNSLALTSSISHPL